MMMAAVFSGRPARTPPEATTTAAAPIRNLPYQYVACVVLYVNVHTEIKRQDGSRLATLLSWVSCSRWPASRSLPPRSCSNPLPPWCWWCMEVEGGELEKGDIGR